jgi:putative ABC transport system permease protein
MKLLLLTLKNLRRNPLRAGLTSLAVVVLVALFGIIFSILGFLDRAVADRTGDVPVVLTERYRIPSRFDRRFLEQVVQPTHLNDELKQAAGFQSEKHTLWHFIGFTLDPDMKNKDLQFFVIATIPEKMPSMIDEMSDLDPKLCQLMKKPPRSRLDNAGILMGPERLKKLGKKVGDVFKAKSISHRDGSAARQPIEMELEIVGELPSIGRWAQYAFMDYAYVDRVLKDKKCELDGKIMLGWLRFDDQSAARIGSSVIERHITDIKSEIASTAVSRFMEPYQNLLNGVRYLLVPAIVVVMIVIVANAISITVRERTTEMAVLKVLGFPPPQILLLVLGEGLLLGLLGGGLGAVLTYGLVNHVIGGVPLPIAFFPVFFVSPQVFWWGPVLGVLTAFLGGILPAWNARSVKVSEVFAKVA